MKYIRLVCINIQHPTAQLVSGQRALVWHSSGFNNTKWKYFCVCYFASGPMHLVNKINFCVCLKWAVSVEHNPAFEKKKMVIKLLGQKRPENMTSSIKVTL